MSIASCIFPALAVLAGDVAQAHRGQHAEWRSTPPPPAPPPPRPANEGEQQQRAERTSDG